MKKLVIFILFILFQNAFSQEGRRIETQEFTGIIFPKENNPDANSPSRMKRFTPTKKQIYKLEYALRKLNENKITVVDPNLLPPEPICADLTKYYRQYFGFYNGDIKLILVKLFPKETFTTSAEIAIWKNEILLLKYPEMEYPTLRYDVRTNKFQENYACPE